MKEKIPVSILGASGFVGSELIRLLLLHPHVDLRFVSSERNNGLHLHKFFLHLRDIEDAKRIKFKKLDSIPESEVIFSCLPTGVLPKILNQISQKSRLIINVSGDYRLKQQQDLATYYPETLRHPPLEEAYYYIPELVDFKLQTKIVNLPGCTALASIYSLYPLVKNKLIQTNSFVVDAKVGSSGSGIHSQEPHAIRSNNVRAYKVHGHRHEPEIRCFLEQIGSRAVELQFSVYSLDLSRGIFVSSYAQLSESTQACDVRVAFMDAYRDCEFVRVIPDSYASYRFPTLKSVLGTNYAEIGISTNKNKCVIVTALDNLIKGAAGQAVQTFNKAHSLPEACGLTMRGVWP
jgi:N-acetyl-gamma-glutamyl-phosphate reductase